MPDDQSGNGQIPVSPNNPCPFLRALVANGYVAGHIVPLPKIATTIEKASGRKVEATRSVDPGLIGGIVLQIGSHRADGSVRGRLERLRHELATAQ